MRGLGAKRREWEWVMQEKGVFERDEQMVESVCKSVASVTSRVC